MNTRLASLLYATAGYVLPWLSVPVHGDEAYEPPYADRGGYPPPPYIQQMLDFVDRLLSIMTAAVIVTVIASILWKPLKMYRAWIVLGWLGFGTLLGLFAHVWQLFVVLVLLCAGLCIYAVFLRLRHAAAFKPRHE